MGTTSQYCLRWNNHQTNLLMSVDSLLRQESFTDVTLACEGGVNLHAHRLVLAACSSYFANLLSTTSPLQHPIVVLKDVEALEMRALLNYMYRGEVNVEQSHLKSLLKVAESLKVKGLVEDLEADTQTQPLPLTTSHPRPMSSLISNQSSGYLDSRTSSPSIMAKDSRSSPALSDGWTPNMSKRMIFSPPSSPSTKSRLAPMCKEENSRSLSSPTHPYIHSLNASHTPFNHQHRIHSRVRDICDLDRLDESQRNFNDDQRHASPLPVIPHLELLHPPGAESPTKRSRHLVRDPLISPNPILRTALAHSRSLSTDVTSLVSLANSMLPLPSLLAARVPSILTPEDLRRTQELQQEEQLQLGLLSSKKTPHLSDEDSRHFPDISGDEESLEKVNNGQIISDFGNYHVERNNTSGHFSNFVSYVTNPKPEWKRYKQYTKTDLMDAIAAVKKGMTALQASRKYKVPSRTLYDKIKKMGINTIPKRLPSKRNNNTNIDDSSNVSVEVALPGALNRHGGSLEFFRHSREADDAPLQLEIPPLDLDVKRPSSGEGSDAPQSYGEGSPIETATRGSFSLVGRKVYPSGASSIPLFPSDESNMPLDLTEAEVPPNRPHLEERV